MITTTIEQSKKLVELGIDPSTADMYYAATEDENKKLHYTTPPRVRQTDNAVYKTDIPAWSLSALLELMPATIQTKEGGPYSLMFFKRPPLGEQKVWYNVEYGVRCPTRWGWLNEWYEIKAGEDLTTACYDMVCWLLENKYI